MKDHIVRAISGKYIRAYAAVTKNMVQDAQDIHNTSPLATVALGRTMTAAAMMSRMLMDEKDTLTIQIKGDGPLGGIVVVSDSNSNVRGYVHNPKVYLPLNDKGKFDIAGAVGKNGYLNIIKDLGLKEPYVGYVNLVSGEIAEDIAYYFAYSEQVPTAAALGVLIGSDGNVLTAGGYIIQLMPDAGEDVAEFLEERVRTAGPVTNMLSEGLDAAGVLKRLLGERELELAEELPCRYACNCSRERMERNLISLGRKELAEMAEEQHGAEVQCHFCNSRYYFTEEELRMLIDSLQ